MTGKASELRLQLTAQPTDRRDVDADIGRVRGGDRADIICCIHSQTDMIGWDDSYTIRIDP